MEQSFNNQKWINRTCESESSSMSHSEKRYDWEDEINSQGELFYVEHNPSSSDNCGFSTQPLILVDENIEKENQGIFGRLMRRRNSRRSLRRKDLPKTDFNTTGSSLKDEKSYLPEFLEKIGEEREPINIYVKVDFSSPRIIGRRATAIETFLGLKVMFKETKIIISDIIPNSLADQHRSSFQKGDCLHSINGILVTSENIEQYLRNISFSKEVKEVVLNIHRAKSVVKNCGEVSQTLPLPVELDNCDLKGFGVMFAHLNTRSCSDNISSDDIIFYYPTNENNLKTIKGTFLTLLHLLPTAGAGQPVSTSLKSDGFIVHVLYTWLEDYVLLLAMPDSRISLKECIWVNASVVRCLQFTFQTLPRCFKKERNTNSLEKFFHAFFMRIANRKSNKEFFFEFESLLPAAHCLILPHHLFVQVDDALNELEANDIEIYEEHRFYSIIGSCYFYKGYKVCSHFAKDDLVDIMSLCQQSDILSLMKIGVKELIFWKEVYPSSVERGHGSYGQAPYTLLPANWYLLMVAKDQNFLFVLLESNDCARTLSKSGPDVAYIEEALATLKHLIKIGIPHFVNKLLKSSEEPKNSSTPLESNLHSSFSETTLTQHHSLCYRSLDISRLPRSRSTINLVSSSGYCNGSLSSDDCPPVIGRRAERELAMETISRVSDYSDDSDWNKECKGNLKGQSCDQDDAEVNIQPKLSTGNDVMLHYVHLDKSDGILISPVTSSPEYDHLLNNFRFNVHKIRQILMNTIAFKKLKTQEVAAMTFNKSLIAIKEHGMLFGYEDTKGISHTYWVVGRLFFSPHLKEVYVCYWDTCPQSMIEVAFRLALKCSFQ